MVAELPASVLAATCAARKVDVMNLKNMVRVVMLVAIPGLSGACAGNPSSPSAVDTEQLGCSATGAPVRVGPGFGPAAPRNVKEACDSRPAGPITPKP